MNLTKIWLQVPQEKCFCVCFSHFGEGFLWLQQRHKDGYCFYGEPQKHMETISHYNFFHSFFQNLFWPVPFEEAFHFQHQLKISRQILEVHLVLFYFYLKQNLPGQFPQLFAGPVQWEIVHAHFSCYILLKNMQRQDYAIVFSYFFTESYCM